MIPPKITPLPPAPVRTDAPVDFSSKADAMVGALQPFANQANILAEFVNTRADNASASAASVAGVQAAVGADRVLSQQAASNAAGSAAAAAASANTASSRATAAQQSANASEASAARAEYAAQYVENIADGAAPINNPNFQGVVKVNNVPLGTAATRNVGTGSGDVMAVGAFGLGGRHINTNITTGSYIGTYTPTTLPVNYPAGEYRYGSILSMFHGYAGTSAEIVIPHTDGGGIKFRHSRGANFIDILHTNNILTTTGQSTEYPMTQKAVTDAINAAIANIDVSGPRPTKDHGAVATAGSQTVVCNVQESDFHIMSMETANTTGRLTIDFANIPNLTGKHFSWHVQIQRGGRKSQMPLFAQTVRWAGGAMPELARASAAVDVLMFYKVGDGDIRGMLVDAY